MHTLSFNRKLNKFVDDNELLPSGAAVVVACSGGPDSLALLDWLLSQQEKRQLAITAAHFEHGIRGEESRADAAFVHDFCVSRGIPCRIGHGDVPAYAAEKGLSMETAARELRYAFLRKVATECFSAIKPLITRWDTREVFLAVGHHGDDQAETVLMRILRGTGVNGLAAMRPSRLMTEWLEPAQGGGSILPVHCRLIRPLLAVSRQEIEEYCVLRGLEPRRDATNDEPDEARRNSLRLELLPLLRERYNPEINAALCHLAEIAADMSDCVSALTDEKAAGIMQDNTIDRPAFSVCPKAVQQALIRKLPGLENCSYNDIEAVRRLICTGDSGQQLSLPGAILRLEYDRAIFARTLPVKSQNNGGEEKKISLNGNGDSTKAEFCGRIITAVYTKAADEAANHLGADDESAAVIDADKVKLPLIVRCRRPGDAYLLSGSGSGRKKVKDYFIDRKVPREVRDTVPILTDSDGNILWLAGFIRSGYAMIDKNTTNIIRVTVE
ncbi:MAG: tRNA lysidine(34) synthetase TilS [Selenomonadaceae bacterium]|nr:tRNA lysidine(34) synthetase TilS [Selenomonadaceae bacterium]